MIRLTRRDQVRPVEYVECECNHGQAGYFCTVEELRECFEAGRKSDIFAIKSKNDFEVQSLDQWLASKEVKGE